MKWYHENESIYKVHFWQFVIAFYRFQTSWYVFSLENNLQCNYIKRLEIKKIDRRQELHQHCMFTVGILFTTPITPMAIIAVVLIFLSVWD